MLRSVSLWRPRVRVVEVTVMQTIALLLGAWVLLSLCAGAVWARTYPTRCMVREPMPKASPRFSAERIAG